MVFDGEDDGQRGRDKGALGDGLDDVPEGDLGGEGVAVVDDGLAVVAVPAVELHATAAGEKDLEGKKRKR